MFWTMHVITDPTTVPTEYYLGGFNGEVEIGPDRLIVTGRLTQAPNDDVDWALACADVQMVLRHSYGPDAREVVLWSVDARQAFMDARPGGHVRAEARRCDDAHPDAPLGYLWTTKGDGTVKKRGVRLTFDF